MPTVLNVLFSEKSAAKAMGARWDGASRAWFIPDSIDPAPRSLDPSGQASGEKGSKKHIHLDHDEAGLPTPSLYIYARYVPYSKFCAKQH